MVHNGTVFDSQELSPYLHKQEGTTDSERILLYIVDSINKDSVARDNEFKRMELIDDIIHIITPGNKINLLIYDGENLYVHKNEPGTMFRTKQDGAVILATHPLDNSSWEEVPQNQLQVYKDGRLIYEGRPHENTYYHSEEKMRLIYMDHAML